MRKKEEWGEKEAIGDLEEAVFHQDRDTFWASSVLSPFGEEYLGQNFTSNVFTY